MKSPLHSWRNLLRKLNYKVDWSRVRAHQAQRLPRRRPQHESLENRQLLAADSLAGESLEVAALRSEQFVGPQWPVASYGQEVAAGPVLATRDAVQDGLTSDRVGGDGPRGPLHRGLMAEGESGPSAPSGSAPSGSGPSSSGPSSSGPSSSGPSSSGPSGPSSSGPTASGPSSSGPSSSGPTASGPSGPTSSGPSGPTDSGPSGPTDSGPSGPTDSGPTSSGPTSSGPSGPSTCEAPGHSTGSSDYSYHYGGEPRLASVSEGVESDFDVANVSYLRGSTSYQSGLFNGGIDSTSIQLTVPSNLATPDSPEYLELRRGGFLNDTWRTRWSNSTLTDNQDANYELVGTYQVSSSGSANSYSYGVSSSSVDTYEAVFVLEDRYYAIVSFTFSTSSQTLYDCPDDRHYSSESLHVSAIWLDATQYQFSIDWEDGATSLGGLTVQQDGRLAVSGAHAYEWGDYHPTVRYHVLNSAGDWQWAGSFYGETDVQAHDALLSVPFTIQSANVDGELSLTGVLFTDDDPLTEQYTYTVNIDWGDGTTSEGRVSRSLSNPHEFTIHGFHVYNQLGSFSGSVTIVASDNSQVTGHFNAQVTSLSPSANDNTYTVIHDRELAGNVLFNDPDPSGLPRTTQLTSGVTNGTLEFNAGGSFRYVPNSQFVGQDSFVYTVTQDGLTSPPATVTIHVVNHAPTGADDQWYVSHDRRFSGQVLENDSDVDSDTLSASLVTSVSQGTLTFAADGHFEYLPGPGFLGTDQFTYQVSDGIETSSPVTVTLDVGNQLPSLDPNQQYSILHDTSWTQTWPTDPDGDALQVIFHTRPTMGSVDFDLAGGTWTYTPEAGQVGDDSFVFSLFDGLQETGTVTVSMSVTNTAPTATADSFEVPHSGETHIAAPGVLAGDSDGDSDTLTVYLASPPDHGQVQLHEDGSFTYTAEPFYFGADSFTYMLSDGVAEVGPILVSLNVVENAPTASDVQHVDWPHDRTLVGFLSQSTEDVDGDELTYELVSGPASGTLVLQPNGDYAYSPAPGSTEDVTFTYRATDGFLPSNVASVSISVSQGIPSMTAPHKTVSHNAQLRGNALLGATDPQPNEYLSAELLTSPTHGYLAFNSDGWFTYQPHDGFVSQDASQWDSFTYLVFDGRGYSTEVTQTIAVTNTAPVTTRDEYTLPHNRVLSAESPYYSPGNQGTNASGQLVFSMASVNDYDFDSDELQYLLVDPQTGTEVTVASLDLPGVLTWNSDGSFSFEPESRLNEEVEFFYAATDGIVQSEPTQVLIRVQDTPLVAHADSYSVNHNLELRATRSSAWAINSRDASHLLFNDENFEGDLLTVTLLDPVNYLPTTASALSLPGNFQWYGDGTFTFQSNAGYEGQVQFAYKISDGVHESDPALVTIDVQRPGPTARDDSYSTQHDQSISGNVSVNDFVEGDMTPSLELLDAGGQVVDAASLNLNGTLSWASDGSFTYTPDAGWHGVDTFAYRVFDGFDYSPVTNVSLTVRETIPIPRDHTFRVLPDGQFTAPPNDNFYRPNLTSGLVDLEGDTLTVASVSGVQHGTLQWQSDGSYVYTPDPGFRGVDGFTYQVTDGLMTSEIAQVTFRVENHAPQVQDDTYQASPGLPLVRSLVFNDVDLDGDSVFRQLARSGGPHAYR